MIDVETARTFTEVVNTGSFHAAAGVLNVTQSTVSARIRTLEQRLGRPLFDRARSGATLNAQGQAFRRYALAIVNAWEEGRRLATETTGEVTRLRIGGEHNLWTRLLTLWLLELRAAVPDAHISARAGDFTTLDQALREGDLDVAVMHCAPDGEGFEAERLFDDELILVTSGEDDHVDGRLVDVRWSIDRQITPTSEQLGFRTSRLSLDLGFAAINYLMQAQAAGYLPRRLVDPFIEAGFFKPVSSARPISSPVFAVTRAGPRTSAVDKSLMILRDLAPLVESRGLPPPFWSQLT